MPGDEENDAVSARNCLLKRPVDCAPGAVESHSVKIDGAIWLESAAAKLAVPGSVERSPESLLHLRSCWTLSRSRRRLSRCRDF